MLDEYDYDIVRGDTYMDPVKNGIFWNAMKENHKDIVAGFSSSSVLGYNSIFNITHIYILPFLMYKLTYKLCLL